MMIKQGFGEFPRDTNTLSRLLTVTKKVQDGH